MVDWEDVMKIRIQCFITKIANPTQKVSNISTSRSSALKKKIKYQK